MVRDAGGVSQDDSLDPRVGENSNPCGDLPRGVAFVKMNAALRENYSPVCDSSQNEPPRMSRDRGLRQLGEIGISNRLLRGGVRDQNVQSGTENDRGLGIPRAEVLDGCVAHDQAAEIGGADSGLRVPAITSGCSALSRMGVIFESCFG